MTFGSLPVFHGVVALLASVIPPPVLLSSDFFFFFLFVLHSSTTALVFETPHCLDDNKTTNDHEYYIGDRAMAPVPRLCSVCIPPFGYVCLSSSILATHQQQAILHQRVR